MAKSHVKTTKLKINAFILRNLSEMDAVLRRLANELDSELYDLRKEDVVSYAVAYGEFEYKAEPWEYMRRVICKIE